MAKVVIFRGDAVEHETRLEGSTVRIGRNTSNDIVLDDSLNGVSRFHAEIRAEGGTYYIVDLNSRNGVWIKGRRIKDKAALEFGVPVTLGAFELALEDDVSTGEFGEAAHPSDQQTVVNPASVDPGDGPGGSGTRSRSMPSFGAANRRQGLLWAGAAVIILLICALPFAVVRYKRPPPPQPVAIVELPPPPAAPPESNPSPADVATKAEEKRSQINQHLADARIQMDAREFAAALRDHLQPVLELEPENEQALEWKRQAEIALAVVPRPEKPRPVAKPETNEEPETPGIPRRPDEAYADYLTRAKRVQSVFDEGKRSLDKLEFAAAITRFRAVEHDQPKYHGVDVLITETLSQQQNALQEAMDGGQQNEHASKLPEARSWYRRALEIDPGSTGARERQAAIFSRLTAEANRLFNKATFALKSQDTEEAVRNLQQILKLMVPGDEIREKAAKQLEALKTR